MRPVSQPRGGLGSQGPQALVRLEGLPVRLLPPGGRASARHGCPGRTSPTAAGAGRARLLRGTEPSRRGLPEEAQELSKTQAAPHADQDQRHPGSQDSRRYDECPRYVPIRKEQKNNF